MEREDILHLARLSRIKLSDLEIERFGADVESILAYVDSIRAYTPDATERERPLMNVFRDDVVSVTPDTYTEALLSAAPRRRDRFLVVKKILGGDHG